MRKRIRCPFHKDSTASLLQYEKGWYCFGACNKLYSHEEVESRLGVKIEYDYEETEPEDVSETFKYIDSLLRKEIRGLTLPTDEGGYFICWPDREYYKYRRFDADAKSKYLGPSGHKPPLFWANKKQNQTLVLIEGEINALSLARACPYFDICSFGSASCFNSSTITKQLHIFKRYSNILVILDKDPAGLKALIETKAALLYKIPYVRYLQLEKDINEILCERGEEEVRKTVQGQNS